MVGVEVSVMVQLPATQKPKLFGNAIVPSYLYRYRTEETISITQRPTAKINDTTGLCIDRILRFIGDPIIGSTNLYDEK